MPEENLNENNGERPIRMNEMIDRPFMDDREYLSPGERLWRNTFYPLFEYPVCWIREKIERLRGPKYYYYHQKFRRVPTIDECYTDDHGCIYEANLQMKRDRKVDYEIVDILRRRFYNCLKYERNVNEYHRNFDLCPNEKKDWQDAEVNYFIKYGDLGPYANVMDVYTKQKHRLIWERRQAEKQKKENE